MVEKENLFKEVEEFFNNAETQYETVLLQIETMQSMLNDGFVNNLPTSSVTTCPFVRTLNLIVTEQEVSIDPCAIIEPVYPALYYLFYVLFFSSFLSLTFYILINLRGN